MIPSVPEYLPSEILNQRPDIRARGAPLIAANAKIGVAKAQFFPQLSLEWRVSAHESVALNNSVYLSIEHLGGRREMRCKRFSQADKLVNNLYMTEAIQREALHQYLSAVLTHFKRSITRSPLIKFIWRKSKLSVSMWKRSQSISIFQICATKKGRPTI